MHKSHSEADAAQTAVIRRYIYVTYRNTVNKTHSDADAVQTAVIRRQPD